MAELALTLEDVFSGPGYGAIPASPLQRAICRAAEGRPLDGVLDDAALEQHFGTTELDGLRRPRTVQIVSGIRGGKSALAACAGIHAGLTADLSALKQHEVPRVAIVAPGVDAARATFTLLVGFLSASPILINFVEGEPTADSVMLRRHDGRRVEIVVVAAHRGGLSFRNRWLCAFVLDEVAQFGAEASGAVVNAEEMLRAGEGRLVPGGQGWLISSPYGRTGLLHDLHRRHFGSPGDVLVVHAPTRALNPSFPQETIDAIRLRDPDAAAREFDAEWLDPETALLGGEVIGSHFRAKPRQLSPQPSWRYIAATDPGTRGNAWPLVVVGIDPDRTAKPRMRVALAKEWRGSAAKPLDPGVVLQEMRRDLSAYGIAEVHSDQWAADALRSLAMRCGLTMHITNINSPTKVAMYEGLRANLLQGNVELPPEPQLRTDLLNVRKVATAGGVKIDLRKTADGRHADYAAALALAIKKAATHAIASLAGASASRGASEAAQFMPQQSTIDFELLPDGSGVRLTNKPRRYAGGQHGGF